MDEIFEQVPGYGGLILVSNFGNVKIKAREWESGNHGGKRRIEERQIKTRDSLGYRVFDFHYSGQKKILKVHRIVGALFVPNPENKPFINHKDMDRANNHFSNLEWTTAKENIQHARNNKTWKAPTTTAHGERAAKAKLTKEQALHVKNSNSRVKDLAELYNVNTSSICRIRSGTNWKHL